jgi:TRAP-type C4-dicarboxylate transport system substrate-binding protein
MSPDIQATLLELNREANHQWRSLVTEEEKLCYHHFDKDPNVEVYSFDPGEYENLKEIAQPLIREFAEKMDSRGIPATEALDVILDDLKALGINKG